MINSAVTMQPSKYTKHNEGSSFLSCFTANRAFLNQTVSTRISSKSSRRLIPENKTKPLCLTKRTWMTETKIGNLTATWVFLFVCFLAVCVLDETMKDAGTVRLDSCRLWTEPCGYTTNTPFKVALKDVCIGGTARIGTHSAAKKTSQQTLHQMRWTDGPLSLRFEHAFS